MKKYSIAMNQALDDAEICESLEKYAKYIKEQRELHPKKSLWGKIKAFILG